MYVIGYDIACARRRARVRRQLRKLTPDWQQSFFALRLHGHEADALFDALCLHLEPGHDGLLMAAVAPPAPGMGLAPAGLPAGAGLFVLG